MEGELPPEIPPEAQPQEVHVPINDEEIHDEAAQELGEAAIVGTDPALDPQSGQERPREDEPTTRVQDEAKAADMAEAGDEDRTAAAQQRAAGRLAEDVIKSDKGPFEDDKQAAKFRALEKHPGLKGDDQFGRPDNVHWEVSHAREAGEQDPRLKDYLSDHLRYKAESRDHVADQIETWAGILHDHPVSEAYKARYPLVDFTPTGLTKIDDLHKYEVEDLERLEEGLSQLTGVNALDGRVYTDKRDFVQNTVHQLLDKNYGHDVEALRKKRQQWTALLDSPSTTLGEIRDFYAQEFEAAVLDPMKGKVNITSALLEDVRSGRAAQG